MEGRTIGTELDLVIAMGCCGTGDGLEMGMG